MLDFATLALVRASRSGAYLSYDCMELVHLVTFIHITCRKNMDSAGMTEQSTETSLPAAITPDGLVTGSGSNFLSGTQGFT